ncbi:MAG: cupin-like domain-containing protein [Polyangiaceae bacterium]
MSSSRFRTRRLAAKSCAELTLSDEFRKWIVDNALDGVAPPSLVSTLVQGGVPIDLAHREVSAIVGSPALGAAREKAAAVRRLELLCRLRRTHQAGSEDIDRRPSIDAESFYRDYFAAGRPLILTEFTRHWPALGRWSLDDLRARFGEAEVEVMADREADPERDRNFEAHRRNVRFGEYLDRIAGGASNDTYLVAHNAGLQNPALRPLLDDVRPPADMFDLARLPVATSLWVGPAGTHTPLHHDTTNLLFCQMWGRKRFWLISPFETALLHGARDFYAAATAEDIESGRHPELAGVRVSRLELGPGDALFLPAGTWHEVLALEPSISISLLAFHRPNDLSWYAPGAIRP